MSILKLANAGDEATLTITGCEEVEGQYGAQVKFVAGEDVLFLPKASADRQLERIGFLSEGNDLVEASGYGDVTGQTLTFSRAPNSKPGSKPFWNINVAGNGKPAPKPNPAKTPVPAHSNVPDKDLPPFLQNATAEDNASLAAKVGVDLTGIQKDCAIYQAQTEFVLRAIAPLYANAGIGMSPESAAACVQTLFINSTGGRK